MKKLLVCILLFSLSGCLVMSGCSSASCTKYDPVTGNVVERTTYNRWGNQKIGSIIREADGSFLLEDQQSEHAELYKAINKLVDKVPGI